MFRLSKARAALILAIVALVTFGVHARKLGFYLDDWVMLERLLDANGWWAGVKSLAQTNYAFRTLSLIVFPTLFTFFKDSAFGWQATLIVLDWALAYLFYLWLREWLRSERPALVAAALALMLPICPSSHYWITNISQRIALPLAIFSLLLHRRWLQDRDPKRLGLSLAAYIASLLLYESATFFPFIQAAVYFAGLKQAGKDPKDAAKKTARDVLAPYLAALALAGGWRLLYPVVFGHGFPVKLSLGLKDVLRSYESAGISWTTELYNLCRNAGIVWRHAAQDGQMIFWGLFTAGTAAALSRPSEEKPGARGLTAGAAIAASGFVFGYLPFALSGAYEPQVVGILSRVNAAGVLFLGTAIACLLEALELWTDSRGWITPGRILRGLLLAGLIGPFTWTNWYIGSTWVEAYNLEEKILAGIKEWVVKLPTTHTIVLQDAPSNYNGAEVFSFHWGFDAGLRIRSGRKDLSGIVVQPTMRTEKQGLVDYAFDPPHIAPYEGMLIYNYPSGQMRRPVAAN
ncbi:MAG: hypothetical protein HY925_00930 [Elusimicrobia bacterium]|nr:hypothetical protein [Elusimicrobiota bacterium]